MDYTKSSETIADVLKSAAPQGGTTMRYSELANLENARDSSVSQLKANYTQETQNKLDTKAFSDVQKTYQNMMYSAEGDLDTLKYAKDDVQGELDSQKTVLIQNEQARDILQILTLTLLATFVVYFLLGSFWFVHLIAFIVLGAGFGYSLYLKLR